MEFYSEKADQRGIALTLHQIGMIHQNRGDYDAALEKYNESLEIAKKLGDQSSIAIIFGQIGNIHHHRGDYDAALAKFNESLQINIRLRDQSGIASSSGQIGILLLNSENYKEAFGYLHAAYSIFDGLKLDPQKQKILECILEIRNKIGEEEFNTLIESLSSDKKDVTQ